MSTKPTNPPANTIKTQSNNLQQPTSKRQQATKANNPKCQLQQLKQLNNIQTNQSAINSQRKQTATPSAPNKQQ